ncbi:MAG: hypothetical protein U0R68_05960 [Candidatus Nanopelagicales bacterium]
MAESTSDPLTWVSLGNRDIEAGGLSLVGDAWSRVIPADVDNRVGPELMAQMPSDGWRELSLLDSHGPNASHLFAAPNEDGWALVHLTGRGDGLILSGDPGPYLVRPGRPRRRQGLALTWPEGIRCQASDLGSLSVTLQNTSATTWVWDPEDHGYVHGWLLDDRGDRLAPGYFAYTPRQHPLRDLAPGESMSLGVDFGPAADRVRPGRYDVEAVLTALDLWSTKATLVVT